jgi:membrane protein
LPDEPSAVGIGMSIVIGGHRALPLLKKTVREIGEDRVPSLAAETAYYFFFSLFPLLLFLTPLLGLLGNGEQLVESLLSRLAATMPPDALSLLRRTLVETVQTSGGPGIMSLGALLAGWAGSNIFGSLMEALNVAYDATETRPWWKRIALRLVCLGLAGAVVFGATAIFLFGDHIARWAGDALHLGVVGATAFTFLEYLVAVALVVALGAVIYKLLPNVQQRWTHVIVASMVATVLWLAATLLFRIYVSHFGSFNKTYGTIGGVIALLSWMYYTMLVVLSAGELASELHQGTAALDPDTGAIYLGRIVSEPGPTRPSIEKVNRAP